MSDTTKVKFTSAEADILYVTVMCIKAFLMGVGMKEKKRLFVSAMNSIVLFAIEIDQKCKNAEYFMFDDDLIFTFTEEERCKLSRFSWMSDMADKVNTTLIAWEYIGMKIPDGFSDIMRAIHFALRGDEL